MSHAVDALTLMVLSMLGVGLWTMRVTLAASRRKLLTSGVAAIEAVVFVVSFSRLATDLDRPARLVGYAAGVALGTMIGLTVTDAVTNRPAHSAADERNRAQGRDRGRSARQPLGFLTVPSGGVQDSEVEIDARCRERTATPAGRTERRPTCAASTPV